MALEPNKTALEFETMLRRHLKNGGGPVAACAGFDADAASAYLEGALGQATQARYESHLAGCPTCRRQVIELSRLSLMVEAPVAAKPKPAPEAWWSPVSRTADAAIAGLKNLVDVSSWRWNWRIAGMTATAGAALAVVLVVQPWRESARSLPAMQSAASEPNASAAFPSEAQTQPTANLAADSAVQPAPTPAAEVADNSDGFALLAKSERDGSTSAVPMPPKQIGPATPVVAGAVAQDALTAFSSGAQSKPAANLVAQAPPAPPVMADAPRRISTDLAFNPSDLQGPLRSGAAASSEEVQLGLPPEPVVSPRIAPSSDDNPMRSVALRQRSRETRARAENSAPSEARPGWYDRVMGFMPVREAEKQEAKKTVEDDETVSPLIRKLRDKTFRYDRGMWVDQSYKPEIMAWRVVRLTRNGKEYERVLASDPQLREFFSLGPVIVVWRDKVYRVMGQ